MYGMFICIRTSLCICRHMHYSYVTCTWLYQSSDLQDCSSPICQVVRKCRFFWAVPT